MIDLGTVAGLHEHHHALAANCPRCDRWRTLLSPFSSPSVIDRAGCR